MKKQHFLLALLCATFSLSSCDDDCDHNLSKKADVKNDPYEYFAGTWYEEEMNEEIRFSTSGTFYDKYCTTQSSGETEGRYEVDTDGKRLTQSYTFMGQAMFNDWTVKDKTDVSFAITNNTVGTHIYEKVVETYTMNIGETVNIDFSSKYPSYTVTGYVSSNPRIASVSSAGIIQAVGEKGTAYIKIECKTATAWVKVIVGDDCLDLWYDYISLFGYNYNEMKNILGIPSISGEDGYSFGYRLNLHDIANEIDLFMDSSTGLIDEMALSLKKPVPESNLLTYMNSRYYKNPSLGENYYTNGPTLDESIAIISFDKQNNCIRFLNTKFYTWPDYTSEFGKTTNEIIAKFGPLYYDVLPYYDIINKYVYSIYFNMDKNTDKVTAYFHDINKDIPASTIVDILSTKYNHYRTDETNTMYAFRDGDTQESSKVMIIYDSSKSTATYYDLLNYGKSNAPGNISKVKLLSKPFDKNIIIEKPSK